MAKSFKKFIFGVFKDIVFGAEDASQDNKSCPDSSHQNASEKEEPSSVVQNGEVKESTEINEDVTVEESGSPFVEDIQHDSDDHDANTIMFEGPFDVNGDNHIEGTVPEEIPADICDEENLCSNPSEGNDIKMEQVLSQLSILAKDVKYLLQQNLKYEKELDEKELIIRQQHGQLLKFQDDVIYKTQKPLIMELISLADNIRTVLRKQLESPDYQDLLDDVKRCLQWVESSLEDNGVRRFEESSQGYNAKRQTIVDIRQSDSLERTDSYVTDQPGYEWSIPYLVIKSDVQLKNILMENNSPQKFSFVIRPEEVIKLK